MISLIVSPRVIPERLEEFLAATEENAKHSFNDEPGCLNVDVTQTIGNAHHSYELHANEDALAAHRSAPHFADWRRAADRCVVPGTQVNPIAEQLFHHRGQDRQTKETHA
jgi:quinol monooxygenase YgiN